MVQGEPERDRTARRLADQVDRLSYRLLDERRNDVRQVFVRSAGTEFRVVPTGQGGHQYPALLRQARDEVCSGRRCTTHAVQEYKGLPITLFDVRNLLAF